MVPLVTHETIASSLHEVRMRMKAKAWLSTALTSVEQIQRIV